MTTELLPDNLINAMTTVFCGQMYDEYGDVEFQHAKRAILVMVDNFNLVERARPARSADAVALSRKLAHRINNSTMLRLTTFEPMRPNGLDEGMPANTILQVLEAFRQQTWAEAIEVAAKVAESYATPEESRDGCGAAADIRALTPLERKDSDAT